jgi:hypothetical protein
MTEWCIMYYWLESSCARCFSGLRVLVMWGISATPNKSSLRLLSKSRPYIYFQAIRNSLHRYIIITQCCYIVYIYLHRSWLVCTFVQLCPLGIQYSIFFNTSTGYYVLTTFLLYRMAINIGGVAWMNKTKHNIYFNCMLFCMQIARGNIESAIRLLSYVHTWRTDVKGHDHKLLEGTRWQINVW